MRIGFIHPDLGIGGAERLVVDAAVGLQNLGHHVEIFTSYHEDGQGGRSFDETKNGALKVHVLGASIFPASLWGRFSILCAILRQVHLSLSLLLSTILLPSCFAMPLDAPFTSSADWSWRRQTVPFDVLVIDQLSASIPLLRYIGGNRVLFYCHFPDLLLSPKSPSTLKKLYRVPLDAFEEFTTGQADQIVVNSEFTEGIFRDTFTKLGDVGIKVIYPGIDMAAASDTLDQEKGDSREESLVPTLLSINRFEGKKNIELAIKAFAAARKQHPVLRLVCAGGYDSKLADNVSTLRRLQELASSLDLTHHTLTAASPSSATMLHSSITTTPPQSSPAVLFLLNIPSPQKSLLLSQALALLYTPSFEHFGIVPLEAMAASLPVLATFSGGPKETIIDRGLSHPDTTGLLLPPETSAWSSAIIELVALSSARRAEIGAQGRKMVEEHFSTKKLASELDAACRELVKSRPTGLEDGTVVLGVTAVFLAIMIGAMGMLAFSLRK